MKPQSPCYGCDERVIGCHSECDLYLEFRRALDRYNEAARQNRTIIPDTPPNCTKRAKGSRIK